MVAPVRPDQAPSTAATVLPAAMAIRCCASVAPVSPVIWFRREATVVMGR